MGLYDREYYRESPPGFRLALPATAVGMLILANVAIYLADGLLSPGHRVMGALALHVDSIVEPLYWWQFVTYGFAHAPWPWVAHILFNMLALYFFGSEIEQLYGRKEFLRLYFVLVVFAGVVWAAIEKAQGNHGSVVGASGAIAGVVILFAMHFPHRIVLLFFVLPVPAWILGVLWIATDAYNALRPVEGEAQQVAYTAHLAGAAFAFLYYRLGWNLGRLTSWLPRGGRFLRLGRRPRLRVHNPTKAKRGDELSDEVDRILEKIHREGEASLTRKERRTLETASRQFQQRRQGGDPGDE